MFYKRNFFLAAAILFLAGCQTTLPQGFLLTPESVMELRQLQSRRYDTGNTLQIITASVGALQDLGFAIDKTEKGLGFLLGSKQRSATDKGQVALAILADALAAAGGTYSNAYGATDKEQKIQASIVVSRALSGASGTIVRASFQRVVWNRMGQISRVETLRDLELYEGFYENLSKAVFLEEHKI